MNGSTKGTFSSDAHVIICPSLGLVLLASKYLSSVSTTSLLSFPSSLAILLFGPILILPKLAPPSPDILLLGPILIFGVAKPSEGILPFFGNFDLGTEPSLGFGDGLGGFFVFRYVLTLF